MPYSLTTASKIGVLVKPHVVHLLTDGKINS